MKDLRATFKEGCRSVSNQLNWSALTAQMEAHYQGAVGGT